MMLLVLGLAVQIPRYPTLPANHSQPVYTLYTSRYACPDCKAAEAEFQKLVTQMPLSQLAIVDCEDDECKRQYPELPVATFTYNNVTFHYNLGWSVSNLTEFAQILQTSIFSKGYATKQAFIDGMEDEKAKTYFIFYSNSLEQAISDALFQFKTRIRAVIYSGEDKIIAFNQGQQYEFKASILANIEEVKKFVNRHIAPSFQHLSLKEDQQALLMQTKRFCLVAVENNENGRRVVKQARKLINSWFHDEDAASSDLFFRFLIVGKDDQLIASMNTAVPFVAVLENSAPAFYVQKLDPLGDNTDAIKSFVTDVLYNKAEQHKLVLQGSRQQEKEKDDFEDAGEDAGDDSVKRQHNSAGQQEKASQQSQKARRGAKKEDL